MFEYISYFTHRPARNVYLFIHFIYIILFFKTSCLNTVVFYFTSCSTFNQVQQATNPGYLYLPLVNLYISLTALVDIFCNGTPLNPPISDLFLLWRVSGLETVVLLTIRPSTQHCNKIWKDKNKGEKSRYTILKVLVPIHSLIPPTFFKHMEILVPKVESHLEGFMCGILCAKLL